MIIQSELLEGGFNEDFSASRNNSSSFSLTPWHRDQLMGLTKAGINCLVKSWTSLAQNPINEPHCNATWDEIYCWPATLAGETVRRPCSEVMKDDDEIDAENIIGDAFRICSDDATWLWGTWTNYNVCIEALDNMDIVDPNADSAGEPFPFKVYVRHILFVGSVLSLITLACAIFIFRYFRSLQCDRNLIHVHMMTALALRSILWLVTTESTIFQKEYNYRSVDWVCKAIIGLQIYSAAAAINWMFVQGHYLHSKLTSNVWQKKFPLGLYIFIGWGIPLVLVSIWCVLMAVFHEQRCWSGYGKLHYLWIIACPLVLSLTINMLLLFNILRILLTKIQLSSIARERDQFKRAVKATVVLFPLLGLNNLVFFYNPGGTGEKYYMLFNAILQSSQGPAVAFLYCFCCKDVQDAIRREYGRFSAKQEVESEKNYSRRSTFTTSIKSRLTSVDRQRSSEQTDCVDVDSDTQCLEFPKPDPSKIISSSPASCRETSPSKTSDSYL